MSKVITFFSSLSNAGTTSTTLSVGYALAQQTEAKVAVLLLNAWDDGTDFYPNPPYYLNEIKSRLAGGKFTNDDDFTSKFKKINNLFILAGNKDRLMERHYTTDEIDYLIERTKEVFDVVLIDAGCHLDNALSVQSLLKSDFKSLVLTQQPKALKRYFQLHETILNGLDVTDTEFYFIVNRYQSKSHLQTKKDIAKLIELPLLTTLTEVQNGWLSELENKILYSYDDHIHYQKGIDTITEKLIQLADLPVKELPKRKGFGRLFRKEIRHGANVSS